MKLKTILLFIMPVTILLLANVFMFQVHSQDIVSLKKTFETSQDDSVKARCLIDIASSFQSINDDSALFYYEKLQTFAEQHSLPGFAADALKSIGVMSYYTGDFDNSVEYYKQAIKKWEEAGQTTENKIKIANLYHNIALVYCAKGDNESAVKTQATAEKIRLSVNDKKGLARLTYSNLGAIYIELGDFPKAQQYFYKTLKIWEELQDDEGIADAYDNIGVVNESRKDYRAALENYQKSLEIRRKIGSDELLSYSYNNIGVAYYGLENFDEAEKYYLKSLELKIKLDDKKGIGNTYQNLGLVSEDKGNLKQSYDYFKKAIQIREEIGDLYGVTGSYISIGAIDAALKKYDEALQFLEKGYNLAKENKYSQLHKDACENLSLAYREMGKYQQAFDMLMEHKDMSDSLFNEGMIKKITSIELQYGFDKKMTADSIKNAEIAFKKDFQTQEQLKRKEIITWSLAAVFALILILVFVMFRIYRLRQTAKQNKLKQKAGEIEKKLLRAQMNPHFIFNSMNSIQNFISRNDTYSAERFLAKFSSLVRLILENTSQSYVCLTDELNSLKIYLELEQLRFDRKFDFEINLDENIEEEFVYVPPMLIQPYVENAILHGIMNKEGKGRIDINLSINEHEKILYCTIIDDGVGRAKAMEIKAARNTKHKSVGMQITLERLEFLKKENKSDISVKLTDLFDERQRASGTKVEIFIPFKDN